MFPPPPPPRAALGNLRAPVCCRRVTPCDLPTYGIDFRFEAVFRYPALQLADYFTKCHIKIVGNAKGHMR